MAVIESVVGAIAGRAASSAATALFKERKSTDGYLVPDDALVQLTEQQGADDPPMIVTEKQRISIESFLERDEVTEIFSAWLLIELAEDESGKCDDILENIGSSFQQMILRWNSGHNENWSSLGPDIWHIATNTLASAVPKLRQLIQADPASTEVHERFSYGARLLRGGRNAPNSHLRRVTAVLTNPKVLLDIPVLVQDICQASAEKFGEVQLGHAQDVADRHEEALLYVERTVWDSAIRPGVSRPSEIRAEDLIGPNRVAHVVITGDPGVGKSTFVRHVVHTLANRQDPKLAPLLVNCRDYAAGVAEKSIVDFIAGTLQHDLAITVSLDNLNTVLTLGAACIIFDGIDEIIDLQQRREFIRRIESLAVAYPYSSIICSTRRVGYQQASFKQSFQVLELREFTPEEFETYVRRWFCITARPEGDIESFLRESKDVRDIRNNPLMLSLLCTLYRARGHIPRNRRQVYRECADLLFQRWDAMRHIEQPFDHRHYGNRLMQELARFFYQSQSAQAGVEEGQLVRIIAHFFRDTAAVEPPEDEQRARQFLEFCAGRAWLLSRKGTNSRGVRLFAFTHRTFMEYMSAEALVRNAPDIRTVALKALEVFKGDPSSIIPDVMVQAVDDKFDRGAEQVLKILFDEGRKARALPSDRFLALCLRIINSSPMSRDIATALPGLVTNYWQQIAHVDDSRESTYALFELYRDPRSRILSVIDQKQRLLFGGKRYDSALLKWHLIRRWVRLKLLGQERLLDPEWAERISSYLSLELVSDAAFSADGQDPILLDFMATAGHAYASYAINKGVKPAVCISVFGERLPGSVIRAMRDIAEMSSSSVHDSSMDIVQTFDQILSASTNCEIGVLAAFSVGEMLKVEVPSWRIPAEPHGTEILSHNGSVLRTLWWLLAILHEAYETNHPLNETLGSLSKGFQELAGSRKRCRDFMEVNTDASGNWTGPQLRYGLKRYATDIRASDLKRWGYDLPEGIVRTAASSTSWIMLWGLGLTSLVTWPRLDFKSTIEEKARSKDYLSPPYVLERWCDFATNVPPAAG